MRVIQDLGRGRGPKKGKVGDLMALFGRGRGKGMQVIDYTKGG